MKHLNTPEMKLKIIEQLIILNDESIFEQIENILDASTHRPNAGKLTKKDLIKRAQQANLDIANKEVFTQDAAERQSQSW